MIPLSSREEANRAYSQVFFPAGRPLGGVVPKKSRKTNNKLQLSQRELIAWIRQHHLMLKTEWTTRLTMIEPIDWNVLEELHNDIVRLERELPWLKQDDKNNV